MPQTSAIHQDIEFEDRYGDKRVIHKRVGGGLAVKRTTVTPVLALNLRLSALIGARIKATRMSRGLSLLELSERAGLVGGKQYMWTIENAPRDKGLTAGTLYAIAMALGVEVVALMPPISEVEAIARPQRKVRTAVGLVAAP